MSYASCWIQACIVIHAFAIDHELDTDQSWLEDGVVWEREQKEKDQRQRLETDTEAAPDGINRETTRQRDQTLRQGKLKREILKQRYLQSLQS